MKREQLKPFFKDCDGFYIEIGPLNNPNLVKNEYPNLKYADMRSTDDVFEEYINGQSYAREDLYEIDYVIADSYPSVIGVGVADAFYSSHVIEHTPDVLQHFTEVGDCLKDGGFYALTIPNKEEYKHDKFRGVTTFRDALDVHKYGKAALARLVFDSRIVPVCFGKNDTDQSENCEILVPSLTNTAFALSAYEDFVTGVAHTWVFSYVSFLEFLRDAISCGYMPYELEACFAPESRGTSAIDFDIVLKKSQKVIEDTDYRIKEICKIQVLIDEYCGRNSFSNLVGNKSVYIYGAGDIGRNFYWYAKNCKVDVKGFVVSDGQPKAEMLYGLPIYYFSEVMPNKNDYYFVVAFYNNEEVAKKLVGLNCDFIRIAT